MTGQLNAGAVAITGLGIVSSLGVGSTDNWAQTLCRPIGRARDPALSDDGTEDLDRGDRG